MLSYGVELDPTARCADAIEFENAVREHFIGQEEAIAVAVRMVQTYMAGMNDPDMPAGVMLMLGPTGTGKTHLSHATAGRLGLSLAGHHKTSRTRTPVFPSPSPAPSSAPPLAASRLLPASPAPLPSQRPGARSLPLTRSARDVLCRSSRASSSRSVRSPASVSYSGSGGCALL